MFFVLSIDVLRKDSLLQHCNFLLSAVLMPVYKTVLNAIDFVPGYAVLRHPDPIILKQNLALLVYCYGKLLSQAWVYLWIWQDALSLPGGFFTFQWEKRLTLHMTGSRRERTKFCSEVKLTFDPHLSILGSILDIRAFKLTFIHLDLHILRLILFMCLNFKLIHCIICFLGRIWEVMVILLCLLSQC